MSTDWLHGVSVLFVCRTFPPQDLAATAIGPSFIVHQTVRREAGRNLFCVLRLFSGKISGDRIGQSQSHATLQIHLFNWNFLIMLMK
jgi:hypothetical protein